MTADTAGERTSHFSAVLPVFERKGELYTRLVLYKNRFKDGRLELRVSGGTDEEAETPLETAVREMEQELGISVVESLESDLLLLIQEEKPDQEHSGGIHEKRAYLCFNFKEVRERRVHEPDIEGYVEESLEDLVRHIAREWPLKSGHKILNGFHRKIIRKAVIKLATEFPELQEVARQVNWVDSK